MKRWTGSRCDWPCPMLDLLTENLDRPAFAFVLPDLVRGARDLLQEAIQLSDIRRDPF